MTIAKPPLLPAFAAIGPAHAEGLEARPGPVLLSGVASPLLKPGG
jgi:hypothetical protein